MRPKCFAVVSSGTDNSGINGAIRAVVRTATGHNAKVFGVQWGYRGFLDNQMSILTSRDVSGKIGRAGCFLGTAKPHGLITDDNISKAIENCHKRNISGIIVIGGLGSLRLSRKFSENGINVIGIPSTIQDDIPGTDISLGVDSAVNNIVKCIDKIRGSSSARDRTYLVEVEGRTCGSLALRAAITSGAEICLVPEQPLNDMSDLSKTMADFNLKGKDQCLAVISTGWKPGIEVLSKYLQEHEEENDLYVRTTVLGYVQRGGAPSGFDRILGTRMGSAAVKELMEGKSGRMIAFQNGEIVSIPYEECLDNEKQPDKELLDLFKLTR